MKGTAKKWKIKELRKRREICKKEKKKEVQIKRKEMFKNKERNYGRK